MTPTVAPKTHGYRTLSKQPVVLSISGNDSAGLAGIAMDIRACQALDVHCATAITALTAQNNQALLALNPTAVAQLQQQVNAALGLTPQAIKIGMLAHGDQAEWLADWLAQANLPVIYDPVLSTSAQASVADDALCHAITNRLLPQCTLITPNIPEAQALTGITITNDQDRLHAATKLQQMGATWVVLKGGHSHCAEHHIADLVLGPDHHFWLTQPKLNNQHSRATGCALASTIAAAVALGHDWRDAIVIANMAVHNALANAKGVNHSKGSVAPKDFPANHWPMFAERLTPADNLAFPACVGDNQPDSLGLYPIVDRAHWLARLLPLGITTAQLRIKDLSGQALAQEIQQAIAIAKRYQCRLFINDHWQLAIEHQAYGLHLGQEDIEQANLAALHKAGLRLGLSSHCHWEVARARAIKPSYIACGPVFATKTKDMPWVPHGTEGLQYWVNALAGTPVVAIGGISASNAQAIYCTKVSGIALISAITQAANPEDSARALLQLLSEQPNRQATTNEVQSADSN